MQGGVAVYDSYKNTSPGFLSLDLRIVLDWEFLAGLPFDRRKALREGIEEIVRILTEGEVNDEL